MRRILIALLAFAATTSLALADFITFEKAKFNEMLKSNQVVVIQSHEWW